MENFSAMHCRSMDRRTGRLRGSGNCSPRLGDLRAVILGADGILFGPLSLGPAEKNYFCIFQDLFYLPTFCIVYRKFSVS